MTEKVRENRLRRMAARNTEYRLIKSRRRDPRAIGYGCYELIHDGSAGGVFGAGPTGEPQATLDEVEEFLIRSRWQREAPRYASLENGGPDAQKTYDVLIAQGLSRDEAKAKIAESLDMSVEEVVHELSNSET